MKVGFRKDGRITALDLFIGRRQRPVRRAGRLPLGRQHRLALLPAAGDAVARHQVLTNTPPRTSQRAPGRHAGQRDHGADHRQGRAQARHRPGRDPQDQRAGRQGAVRPAGRRAASRPYVTSAFVKEALDKGRESFNWDEKKARSGKRAARRCAASASRSAPSRAARSGSTACSSSSRTAGCSSSRASATSAPHR